MVRLTNADILINSLTASGHKTEYDSLGGVAYPHEEIQDSGSLENAGGVSADYEEKLTGELGLEIDTTACATVTVSNRVYHSDIGHKIPNFNGDDVRPSAAEFGATHSYNCSKIGHPYIRPENLSLKRLGPGRFHQTGPLNKSVTTADNIATEKQETVSSINTVSVSFLNYQIPILRTFSGLKCTCSNVPCLK